MARLIYFMLASLDGFLAEEDYGRTALFRVSAGGGPFGWVVAGPGFEPG
jgi:hypothetical protein